MRVLLSPAAERDLEAIGDYIAEDNPARALTFIGEIRRRCEKSRRLRKEDASATSLLQVCEAYPSGTT
jgi:plasmid stabilization system protein ParE